MTQRTSPFLGAKYGWDYGESGWNIGMDENLLKFSYLFDRNVEGIVSTLPAAVDGLAYFLTTDNRLYFGVGTTWYSSSVPKWFILTIKNTGESFQFNGTSLISVPSNSELSTQLGAVQVTLSELGTASLEDVEYFASQAQLDIASAQANSYTDSLMANIASTNLEDGAALVGNGVICVKSYSDIRGLKNNTAAKVANYGGFTYQLDETDTTSVESLPRVIVATDGGRWKSAWKREYDLNQYRETPTSDFSEAANRAFTIGKALTVADGTYVIEDTISSSYASPTFPEVGTPSTRVSMIGESSGNTIFVHSVDSGDKAAFKLEGTTTSPVTQGIHGQDRFGRFSMNRQGNPYPTGQDGVGIYVLNKSMTTVEDIQLQFLGTGVELDGCLSSTFNNMRLLNGNRGLLINATALSLPNALTFNSLMAAGNNLQGVLCNQLGAGNVFIGGSIENNGTQGAAGNGGFIANLLGTNGTACLTMVGVYFEGNGGQADIFLDNVTNSNLTVNLINCTFNRLSNLRYVGSNIDARSSGGGKLKVNLQGCSFLSTGSYVPDSSRPYVFTDGNVEISGWDTCTYSEAVSIPGYMHSSSSAVISGSVTAGGVLASGLRTVSVTRVSAGVYNIDKSDQWAPTVDGYNICVTPYESVARVGSIVKQSDTRTQVTLAAHATGVSTDCAFSFMIARVQ